MYLSVTSDGKYASAATSSRDPADKAETQIDYIYLGRILDLDKGIFKSRERGIFTFNIETGEFGSVPESYVPPKEADKRKHTHVSVDFGDAFFVNEYLHKSGFMLVIDQIGYGNPDTLHAMILFYTLSGLANCDAITWYEGSIAQLLYPNANLASQRISDFLAAIGKPEKQMAFQKAYIKYVMEHYNHDKNILIDSSGLPNNIHGSMTHWNIHNGKLSREIRLIFVVQKSSGLPIYYKAVPGNIVDVSTLERIFLHLKSLGVDISSCIMDAGYNSGDNLDLFYDENHQCKIGFITRIAADDKRFHQMIKEELPNIESKENFVKYEDRFLFIVRREIKAGKNQNNPAWLYLGLDINRLSDERHKLLRRASQNDFSAGDVYEAMQTEGLFGVISGTPYTCEEILPAYYQRQAAEQIFDVAKNYAKLLPLRTNNDETFEGHLLLSYIATCAVKMIQIRLKEVNLFLGSRLSCLRNQKATIYNDQVVTDVPQKEANNTYQTFGITCPTAIPIKDGKLDYTTPEPGTLPPEKKRRKRKKKTEASGETTQKEQETTAPKKRGRPKGSKNKSTIEREKKELLNPPEKRKRGRPKGSKNKKTLEREAAAALAAKPHRGRPKGSKNKKTLERERQASGQST